ncbi:MAG: hypothetical protein OXB93_04940 [Cytophagales bacterium]|nr:hypothetical protein [Cytophagales bacterium]
MLCWICVGLWGCTEFEVEPLLEEPYLSIRFIHARRVQVEKEQLLEQTTQLSQLNEKNKQLNQEIQEQTQILKDLEERIQEGQDELKPQRNQGIEKREQFIAEQNLLFEQIEDINSLIDQQNRSIRDLKEGFFPILEVQTQEGKFISYPDTSSLYQIPLPMHKTQASFKLYAPEQIFEFQLIYELSESLDEKRRIYLRALMREVLSSSFDSLRWNCQPSDTCYHDRSLLEVFF